GGVVSAQSVLGGQAAYFAEHKPGTLVVYDDVQRAKIVEEPVSISLRHSSIPLCLDENSDDFVGPKSGDVSNATE
ncbi:MAG: hypothetical protein NTV52_35800, partial [Acidobacteria bacterium]|nr:hypothetical protein [Acidobacteriota bacterium]